MYRKKLGSLKFIIINIEYDDLNLICTNHSNKQQSFYDILMRYMSNRNTHTIFHIFKKRAISCLVGFLINIIIPYLLSCGCFSKKKCQNQEKGVCSTVDFFKNK